VRPSQSGAIKVETNCFFANSVHFGLYLCLPSVITRQALSRGCLVSSLSAANPLYQICADANLVQRE